MPDTFFFSSLFWVRVLLAWTALGGFWHLATLLLLTWGLHLRRKPPLVPVLVPANPGISSSVRLSLFKPLPPPTTQEEQADITLALESFCRQLQPHHECLIGIRTQDQEAWGPLRHHVEQAFPSAAIRFLTTSKLPSHANPKVAWLEYLSREARGEWWLWSDADITAPEGFLQECDGLCGDASCSLATFPYVIQGVRYAAGAWDLAFNLSDFIPGVFLLGLGRRVHFALGAGILLRAGVFREKLGWPELGRHLADDYAVGQKLGPGLLGRTVLKTTACEDSGWAGFSHCLRWLKTVRWCQPAGFAGHLLVCPILGWWLAALAEGGIVWLGLVLLAGWETLVLALACQLAGSRPFLRALPWFPVICLLRPWLRLACWLPWPVMWRGRAWREPIAPLPIA